MLNLSAFARLIYAIALTCALSDVAQAQERGLTRLETMQDSQGWSAVGRLDIAGKGFCTAALIRDSLILTAAHCLYDRDGQQIEAARFSFQAGLRGGRADATRAVLRAVPHPDYRFAINATNAPAVAVDIAVLELASPIRMSRLKPYLIAPRPLTGDAVRVVSYGRGRADAPSLQEDCMVLGRNLGVLVMTCDVEFGSSGSPVFMRVDGDMRIVSVVSAMAQMEGETVALGTSLQEPFSQLIAHFGSLGPAPLLDGRRLIGVGGRNDTGAKFVRP
ncbi:MAG: trypsin-like serine peptidase [Yoonia sp.]|uniref:trypsin-like serine peptidase n=1 Tax=Yoonia sp. TaxID=2212373 RepID=UPI003EF96B8F